MCRAVPTEALLGLVNQPLGDVNRLEGSGSINPTAHRPSHSIE
jgi:hypothetical protein